MLFIFHCVFLQLFFLFFFAANCAKYTKNFIYFFLLIKKIVSLFLIVFLSINLIKKIKQNVSISKSIFIV